MAADATARFAIKLDDETSGAADAAAGALDKLERQITRDQKALADLERVMKASKKAAFNVGTDYIGMAAKIAAKRETIAGASLDFLKLGGSFGNAAKNAKEGGAAARAVAIGLAALGKPANDVAKAPAFDPSVWSKAAAGQHSFAVAAKKTVVALASATPAAKDTSESFDQLARATKKIGFGLPDQIGDIAGAVSTLPGLFLTAAAGALAFAGALTLGVAAGLFSLLKFAFTAQESLEGVSQAAVNVAKRSPIARTEIVKLSDELEKTGLRGEALEAALDKAVKKKFGKDAEKSMFGLSVQLAKAKENAVFLFTGVKTDKLLDGAAKLFSFLDASTVEGQALQAIIETLLNPIIDGLASAGPGAKKFFQGMIIGALEAGIAILLVKKRLESLIGLKLDLGAVDWTAVGEAVAIAAVAFGLVAAAIGVVVGIVAGSVVAVMALGFAFGLLIAKVIEAVAAIPGALASINNFIVSRVSAMIDAGFQFAAGLAEGIRSGLSEVINAATDIAKGAEDAVKKTLGIASPSKVALAFGDNFGGALAMGAEGRTGDVKESAVGLGEAMVPPAKGGALGAQAGAGGATIHIEQLLIQGVEGADDPAFVGKLTEALQQAAALAGFGAVTS